MLRCTLVVDIVVVGSGRGVGVCGVVGMEIGGLGGTGGDGEGYVRLWCACVFIVSVVTSCF